ncbi:MAG: hypothetical protein ABR581_02090 [Thermoleophilaceae bacterium]
MAQLAQEAQGHATIESRPAVALADRFLPEPGTTIPAAFGPAYLPYPEPMPRTGPSRLVRTAFLCAAAISAWCLSSASPVAGDTPRAGKRYDGQGPGRAPIFLTVRSDGERLSRWTFSSRTRCTDDKRRVLGIRHPGEGPVTIDSNGDFSYTSPSGPLTVRGRHGGRIRGRARATFSGHFTSGGDAVKGTVSIRFRSRHLRCSSHDVAYTLHRDGTPGAAYRNASVASGLYRARGRKLRTRLRMFLPAKAISAVRVRYWESCRSGLQRGTFIVFGHIATRGTLFRAARRERFRLPGGLVSHDRYRFTGRFSYRNGYRVRGRWRIRSRYYRRGRLVEDCTADRRFSGRFVGGPIGSEGAHPSG